MTTNTLKKILLLTMTMVLLSIVLPAQQSKTIARKKMQADTMTNLEKKVKTLYTIGHLYASSDMDSAQHYGNLALELARKNNLKKAEAGAIGMVAILEEKLGNYDKALEYMNESVAIRRSIGDEDGVAGSYITFGNIYLYYYARYDKALELYHKSYDHFENTGDSSRMASILNNIGLVHYQKKDYEKAEKYLRDALVINIEVGNKVKEGRCYNNLSIIHTETERYDEALELLKKAKAIYLAKGNRRGLAAVYTNEGETQGKLGNYILAHAKLDSGRAILQELENIRGLSDNELVAGKIYFEQKDYRKAIEHFSKCFNHSVSTGLTLNQMQSAEKLSESWSAIGKYDSAFAYHKQFTDLKDEIFNTEKEGMIASLEAKFANAEKAKEILVLSKQNEIQKLQLQRNDTRSFLFYVVLAIVILCMVVLLLFFSRFRLKMEQRATDLEQKLLRSQMNPHFIYNSLNAIQHYIYDHRPNEAGEYLGKFANLVRMILENSRDETVSLEKEVKTLEIYLELQKLRFENLFDYKLEVDSELNLAETTVPPMLAQPFIENAIEHAFRDSQSTGMINIRFRKDGEQILFEVEDNGVGINHSQALETNSSKAHKPMALQITKERLELLKAKRKVDVKLKITDLAEIGRGLQGTRVTFYLPSFSYWS